MSLKAFLIGDVENDKVLIQPNKNHMIKRDAPFPQHQFNAIIDFVKKHNLIFGVVLIGGYFIYYFNTKERYAFVTDYLSKLISEFHLTDAPRAPAPNGNQGTTSNSPNDTASGISESNNDYASLILNISTKEVDDTVLRENILPLLDDNSALNLEPYITNQPAGHYYHRRGPKEIQNIRTYIKSGNLTVKDFNLDKLQRESDFLKFYYALI